ncbi:MAG: hypothetical protein NTZ58_06505 [Solirubrobacterales bacterium]|nr:hypothetical protein [Solirubrobacterales bacterium]
MTRPAHLLIALLCASSLAFGVTACGSDSTSSTTTVEVQPQNDQNQNQDQNNNQNNDNQNNDNNNQTDAQRYKECIAHTEAQNCQDIPH